MTERRCATYGCDGERLPHMASCHTHVARYEIPPHDEIECPACGKTGDHGTLHDDLYYCRDEECMEMFDPRRTDYLERRTDD